tara:strand:- start:788 stop:1177 length:390 start_codon:yes stop_codon:yes gene_type:complete
MTELTDLRRGGTSGADTKFLSGYQRSQSASLTITAPAGQKVVLLSLVTIGNNEANYSIVNDGVTIISNKRLQSLNGLGEQVGSFYIGLSGASSYAQISTAVPPISGKSITINNVSGPIDYSYSYAFVSA